MRESKDKYIWIAFAVASVATIFDAVSSWQIIELNPIAVEANPLWNLIEGTLGFGGAMILRAFIGIALLSALLFGALKFKAERARAISRFGIYLSAVVLTALVIYHLWFRFLYS